MARYAREQMPSSEYLAASYYERWVWGLEELLVGTGILASGEIEARLAGRETSLTEPPEGLRILKAPDVPEALRNRRAARMEEHAPPRFTPGDAVVTKKMNPVGHTRLPRYARGRRGEVSRNHGAFVYPDAAAAGLGRQPQHAYSVRFAARELWGQDASAHDAVYLDLFEPYLDPA
jgi:nitrile hydratase